MAGIEVRAVGSEQLAELDRLFARERTTRHCSCMAFCSTGRQFATGWFGGGNRRRFADLARTESAPMGVLARVDGEPVGWCACGPRARYRPGVAGRSRPLASRPREEDDEVWLIACLFVDPAHRGDPVVLPLLRSAVSLARAEGATAIEAWPLAVGVRDPGLVHVGREGVFNRLGFRCVERPSAERAIMRRELSGTPGPSA